MCRFVSRTIRKLSTNFDKIFGGGGRVGCVTSKKQLDFGGGLDHEADPGFFCQSEIGTMYSTIFF